MVFVLHWHQIENWFERGEFICFFKSRNEFLRIGNVRKMAEITKRTTTNSSSKSRKSKNDIIRSTLGMYLKQNNYSVSN